MHPDPPLPFIHPLKASPPSTFLIMSYSEQAAFKAEVAEVQRWWKVSTGGGHHISFVPTYATIQSPRFNRVKRPYTAEDVVSKRGTLPIQYPSAVLGKKLWATLDAHFRKGEPSHTYGA